MRGNTENITDTGDAIFKYRSSTIFAEVLYMAVNNGLIEKIALKIVRTGTDKINFKILEMVNNDGMNINKLIEKTKLTKVPINIRINQLEKVGLVNRWRGTGIVRLTELGKNFMKLIYGYQEIVRSNVMDILKKTYDV